MSPDSANVGLVSILMPAHNAAPWIRETLESALAQTWAPTEIIVVDDGSTDDTAAIASTFADRGVNVLEQEARGAAAARNRAVAASRGAYLQFLDADDLLSPEKIARQIARLRHHPDCVASCAWGRFEHASSEAQFLNEPVWSDADPVSWLVCSWSGGGMMHPAAWLVPRAVAAAAGPWDERLSLNDDGEYFARVLLMSAGVRFCEEARAYYRSGIATSLSRERSDRAWASARLAADLCCSALRAAEDSPRTRRACATVYQRLAYDAYADKPDFARDAVAVAKTLGGSDEQPGGGPLFRTLSRVFGWERAMSARKLARRFSERATADRRSHA